LSTRWQTARRPACSGILGVEKGAERASRLFLDEALRTTLKRGIGQAVGADGDGNGSGTPTALTTMHRYRQPPGRRTALGLVGRILLWGAAVIVMLVAALGGGAWLFFDQSVEAIKPHTKAVIEAQDLLADVPKAGKPTTALILGYDKRFNEGGFGRSDTLILVRADPATDSISMLSFPRDLMVPIYCPGRGVFTDKINAAYANCNVKGSVATIHNLTHLGINYVITVNFRGFRQVVDRLGGVWIDVDQRYYNRNVHTLDTNFANINLKPGYQRLNGKQALEYVRFRHTDSDFHRNARQQQFIKAIKQQISSNVSLFDLPGLLNAITHNVEVGRGGGKDISNTEVLSYARFAYGLPSGHFFQSKIEGITGYAQLTAPPGNIAAAVNEFANPDVSAPEKAEETILGRRRGKKPKIRPKNVTISVLNGNAVAGSAASARSQLSDRGFRTVQPTNPATANAPHQTYWHTAVYYDPTKPRAKDGAKLVRDAFGDANVIEGIPVTLEKLSLNAMTVVVVGKTFHDSLAPAPIDRTPKKKPPVVRRDPKETRGMLRKAQRKVPFRLEVPWVLEKFSDPASTMPIRVYSMSKHKAVRLSFCVNAAGFCNYWGIEQTDWDDAPVLQKPSATRFIKGRQFDLYFNGNHLHMIALRDNGATYWVVNTLLDDLSNETMLAIAKGLRPLKRKP
jgi:LCP family protein required for cell wall assembly